MAYNYIESTKSQLTVSSDLFLIINAAMLLHFAPELLSCPCRQVQDFDPHFEHLDWGTYLFRPSRLPTPFQSAERFLPQVAWLKGRESEGMMEWPSPLKGVQLHGRGRLQISWWWPWALAALPSGGPERNLSFVSRTRFFSGWGWSGIAW